MYAALPKRARENADAAFELFKSDPFHPVLENHELHKDRRGRHRPGSRAVAVTRRYRAIYLPDEAPKPPRNPANVWYWIGTHEDYNNYVGK